MGVGVSGWPLARAVSLAGQLGVISGTGIAVLLSRRLACGDVGGHMRRAMAHFPVPAIAHRILDRHFIDGGRGAHEPYRLSEMPTIEPGQAFLELTIVANFVEVWLAKEGHSGVVGVNYLEKTQIPNLPSILGAMLAGVDYVLMGAGIPRFIPGVLDAFADGRDADLRVDVESATSDQVFSCHLDPEAVLGYRPVLKRPRFFAIISSNTLAMTLARKSTGRIDGFVVEGASAGGHNAPPRGGMTLDTNGEPVYGERDEVDLSRIRELGIPFYLAGSYAEPEQLASALAAGASGVQVGTAFAFCDESSITPELKARAIALSRSGEAHVFTDPQASPTGFPFKVVSVKETHSDADTYAQRARICDLGYLRRPYLRPDGKVGYRCPAEPVAAYVAKGGLLEHTVGRKCLCNALFSTIGFGQSLADHTLELPLVTAGDEATRLARLVPDGATHYSARDVIDYLLAPVRT